MKHDITNTKIEDVPSEILSKVSHIDNPTVKLALSCAHMNHAIDEAYTGPRGDSVDMDDPCTGDDKLDKAISSLQDFTDDLGYDDPYYHPGNDPYYYEFSMINVRTDKRIRLQGDDIKTLVSKINHWRRSLKSRYDDDRTIFAYVFENSGAVKKAFESKTLDKILSDILKLPITVHGTKSGHLLSFEMQGPKIKRAVHKNDGINGVIAKVRGMGVSN